MATVQFNIPDEVEKEFYETFGEENQDHVVGDLIRSAIARRKTQRRRVAAIDGLLELGRLKKRPVSDEEIEEARQTGRP